MNNRSTLGFTLSELLVSLAVLGLIAAFAIPKVLSSVADSSTKAIGKEAISVISAAYDSLKADNSGFVARSTTIAQLVARMNAERNVLAANYAANGVAAQANSTNALKLQSGGIIYYNNTDTFARNGAAEGTMAFRIDPDGTGNFGPVSVYLGFDGRLWVANELYTAGAGTQVSPFNGTYNIAAEPVGAFGTTPVVPANAIGTDTTWFEW
jgi:prepilin-type N-terminal cleavage/methylation domain-containing protein